jgi:hypothetical protein
MANSTSTQRPLYPGDPEYDRAWDEAVYEYLKATTGKKRMGIKVYERKTTEEND